MLHCARRYMLVRPRLLWQSGTCVARFQSSVRTPASEPSAEKGVDEWLEAINELREEFSAKEYAELYTKIKISKKYLTYLDSLQSISD